MKKIVFANDHAVDNDMIKTITNHLNSKGYEVNHMGIKDSVSVDYPDMAKLACEEYLKGGYEFGILICGTGIGISISANKIDGIICSLIRDDFSAAVTKQHNNPNFIAFGARVDSVENILRYIDLYMAAEFEGGRHQNRINKMVALENC